MKAATIDSICRWVTLAVAGVLVGLAGGGLAALLTGCGTRDCDTNVPYERDVALVPGTAMDTNSIEVDAGLIVGGYEPPADTLMSITGGDITVSPSITIGPVSIDTNGTVTIEEGVTMDEASKEFWMRVQALAQQWMYE